MNLAIRDTTQLHPWPTSDDPKRCAYSRWWHGMGEIFGKQWYDKNGPEPGDLWKRSLSEVTMSTGALTLDHYRKSGRSFPPNQSEVFDVLRALHKNNTSTHPNHSELCPQPLDETIGEARMRVNDFVQQYRIEHPTASVADAHRAYMKSRGILKRFEEAFPELKQEADPSC